MEVFEKRLEDRVMEEGISVEDFFLWLKHDLEEDPVSNNSFVVRLRAVDAHCLALAH